jgi:hypothetical protein
MSLITGHEKFSSQARQVVAAHVVIHEIFWVRRMAKLENDDDVAGRQWGDQENSRLATVCYCEQTFSIALDPKEALQNIMLARHSSTVRGGAVLGAILGAALMEQMISHSSFMILPCTNNNLKGN